MAQVPTARDIELAMELYASCGAEAGVKEWRTLEWLWSALPWSARFMTHFGAASLEWWKRKYVLPALCQAAVPFLERFVRTAGSYQDAEDGRRWFFFFAPMAVADPQLFPHELVPFLLDTRASFRERQGYSRAPRQGSPMALREEVREHVPYKGTPVSEETKEAARRLIGKLTPLRASAASLLESVDKTLCRAFPMRNEIQQAMADIHSFHDELFSLLTAVDDGLFRLSDSTFGTGTDREAREIVHEHDEFVNHVRAVIPTFKSRAEELYSLVDELRGGLFSRLHALVRSLDHLSQLDPSNPFYNHQSKIVRGARDQIKKFRLSLAKGPGPEITLAQLEALVDQRIGVSEEFHAEGMRSSRPEFVARTI